MEFVVYRRRMAGRVKPGTMVGGTSVRGRLQVMEKSMREIHRTSRVAQLVGADGNPLEEPPPLFDVTLIFAKPDLWSLAGFELIEVNGVLTAYAQTWFLEPSAYHDEEQSLTAQRNVATAEHGDDAQPLPGRKRSFR